MLEGLLSPDMTNALAPGQVSPAVLALVAEDGPNRTILCAGGGSFEVANITLTQGHYIGGGQDATEQILLQFEKIADREGEIVPGSG